MPLSQHLPADRPFYNIRDVNLEAVNASRCAKIIARRELARQNREKALQECMPPQHNSNPQHSNSRSRSPRSRSPHQYMSGSSMDGVNRWNSGDYMVDRYMEQNMNGNGNQNQNQVNQMSMMPNSYQNINSINSMQGPSMIMGVPPGYYPGSEAYNNNQNFNQFNSGTLIQSFPMPNLMQNPSMSMQQQMPMMPQYPVQSNSLSTPPQQNNVHQNQMSPMSMNQNPNQNFNNLTPAQMQQNVNNIDSLNLYYNNGRPITKENDIHQKFIYEKEPTITNQPAPSLQEARNQPYIGGGPNALTIQQQEEQKQKRQEKRLKLQQKESYRLYKKDEKDLKQIQRVLDPSNYDPGIHEFKWDSSSQYNKPSHNLVISNKDRHLRNQRREMEKQFAKAIKECRMKTPKPKKSESQKNKGAGRGAGEYNPSLEPYKGSYYAPFGLSPGQGLENAKAFVLPDITRMEVMIEDGKKPSNLNKKTDYTRVPQQSAQQGYGNIPGKGVYDPQFNPTLHSQHPNSCNIGYENSNGNIGNMIINNQIQNSMEMNPFARYLNSDITDKPTQNPHIQFVYNGGIPGRDNIDYDPRIRNITDVAGKPTKQCNENDKGRKRKNFIIMEQGEQYIRSLSEDDSKSYKLNVPPNYNPNRQKPPFNGGTRSRSGSPTPFYVLGGAQGVSPSYVLNGPAAGVNFKNSLSQRARSDSPIGNLGLNNNLNNFNNNMTSNIISNLNNQDLMLDELSLNNRKKKATFSPQPRDFNILEFKALNTHAKSHRMRALSYATGRTHNRGMQGSFGYNSMRADDVCQPITGDKEGYWNMQIGRQGDDVPVNSNAVSRQNLPKGMEQFLRQQAGLQQQQQLQQQVQQAQSQNQNQVQPQPQVQFVPHPAQYTPNRSQPQSAQPRLPPISNPNSQQSGRNNMIMQLQQPQTPSVGINQVENQQKQLMQQITSENYNNNLNPNMNRVSTPIPDMAQLQQQKQQAQLQAQYAQKQQEWLLQQQKQQLEYMNMMKKQQQQQMIQMQNIMNNNMNQNENSNSNSNSNQGQNQKKPNPNSNSKVTVTRPHTNPTKPQTPNLQGLRPVSSTSRPKSVQQEILAQRVHSRQGGPDNGSLLPNLLQSDNLNQAQIQQQQQQQQQQQFFNIPGLYNNNNNSNNHNLPDPLFNLQELTPQAQNLVKQHLVGSSLNPQSNIPPFVKFHRFASSQPENDVYPLRVPVQQQSSSSDQGGGLQYPVRLMSEQEKSEVMAMLRQRYMKACEREKKGKKNLGKSNDKTSKTDNSAIDDGDDIVTLKDDNIENQDDIDLKSETPGAKKLETKKSNVYDYINPSSKPDQDVDSKAQDESNEPNNNNSDTLPLPTAAADILKDLESSSNQNNNDDATHWTRQRCLAAMKMLEGQVYVVDDSMGRKGGLV